MELPRYEYGKERGQLMKYSWPGMYPLYYIDRDNAVLCPDCANRDTEDNWRIIGVGVNYEYPDLYCHECSQRIESAYADD